MRRAGAVPNLRLLLVLLFCGLLTACDNRVVSGKPWFTAADEAGAPPLKPGLWAAPDMDCRFDEGRPAEQWPDCAHGRVVRPGAWLTASYTDARAHGRVSREYSDWGVEGHVLATGTPRIDQQAGCAGQFGPRATPAQGEFADGELVESLAEPMVSQAESRAQSPRDYCYHALVPRGLDGEGRIIAYHSWPILCGPWASDRENSVLPTTRPFAGLRMIDQNCVADGIDALRAAAIASEAAWMALGQSQRGRKPSPRIQRKLLDWMNVKTPAHWVRDGYR